MTAITYGGDDNDWELRGRGAGEEEGFEMRRNTEKSNFIEIPTRTWRTCNCYEFIPVTITGQPSSVPQGNMTEC